MISQGTFSLAPIQGITDFTFRNLIAKHFQGIDKVYTPFIRFQSGLEIKKQQLYDILPENNSTVKTIPQVLSNNPDEILFFASHIHRLNYPEFNWNLGCPYPMVAKRQMGSGLLPFPERINRIFETIYEKLPVKISVKMRLGYFDKHEVFEVLDVFEKFQLSEIIIHARIGKQMYKGEVDLDTFENCMSHSKLQLAYNGDINSLKTFSVIKERFKSIDNWMIGRAAVSNPFIFEEIAGNNTIDSKNRLLRFREFHDSLFEAYRQSLSGPGHLLAKMEQLWDYFSKSFINSHKILKMVKKSKSVPQLKNTFDEIFKQGQFISGL
jgi:tRNA-dihydrouridine synthase